MLLSWWLSFNTKDTEGAEIVATYCISNF